MSPEELEAEIKVLREQLRRFHKLALRIHGTTNSEDQAALQHMRDHYFRNPPTTPEAKALAQTAILRADERAQVMKELRACT